MEDIVDVGVDFGGCRSCRRAGAAQYADGHVGNFHGVVLAVGRVEEHQRLALDDKVAYFGGHDICVGLRNLMLPVPVIV